MFLHGNLVHLLANMYSLLYIGRQVEEMTSPLRFLEIYLLTGLVAGLTSLNYNLFVISVGASGAIFGIYGYLIVDLFKKDHHNRSSVLINFVIYLVVVTLIGSKLNFDNAAHLGGAAAGILLGLLQNTLKSKASYLIPFGIIVVAYLLNPRHQVEYFKLYQKLIEADQKITTVFHLDVNDSTLLGTISVHDTIPNQLISEFRALEFVPPKLSQDTFYIIKYLDIKNQTLEYLKKGILQESYIYLDSISWLNSLIAKHPPVQYNLYFGDGSPTNPPIKPESTESLTYVKQHYDSNWFETTSLAYEYYRIGKKDSLGDWHGFVEDYYSNGGIQMKGHYHRGLRDGIFIYYTRDSTYSSLGRYVSDYSIGKWESYYRNGILASEIRHEDQFSYIENTWDSLGHPMVVDRQGEEVLTYPNGRVRFKRSIKNGLYHGFIEAYYKNGDLKFKEYYQNGELINGVSFAHNTENTYDASIYMPYPEGGFDAFYNYIHQYNELESDTVDQTVIIKFDVHHSGKIHNIRFLKRFHPRYDEYAKRLLLNGPTWFPAKLHGLEDMNTSTRVYIKF
ncbi:hypothetical protein BFP72_13050 [Reichenbachiella sp. 5M10]|nr:hypothetical protein BFP72_13050 [Reichenbachiella sp. 5M10]